MFYVNKQTNKKATFSAIIDYIFWVATRKLNVSARLIPTQWNFQ